MNNNMLRGFVDELEKIASRGMSAWGRALGAKTPAELRRWKDAMRGIGADIHFTQRGPRLALQQKAERMGLSRQLKSMDRPIPGKKWWQRVPSERATEKAVEKAETLKAGLRRKASQRGQLASTEAFQPMGTPFEQPELSASLRR